MSRLQLPDDQWAELSAPRKVSERKRRRYIAAMTDLTSGTADLPRHIDEETGLPDPNIPDEHYFTGAHMALSDAVGDQLILCLVREWSFGEVSLEVLENLPVDAFEALFKRCRDLAPELTPDYSPDPDPKATTSVSTGQPPLSSTEGETSVTLSSASIS